MFGGADKEAVYTQLLDAIRRRLTPPVPSSAGGGHGGDYGGGGGGFGGKINGDRKSGGELLSPRSLVNRQFAATPEHPLEDCATPRSTPLSSRASSLGSDGHDDEPVGDGGGSGASPVGAWPAAAPPSPARQGQGAGGASGASPRDVPSSGSGGSGGGSGGGGGGEGAEAARLEAQEKAAAAAASAARLERQAEAEAASWCLTRAQLRSLFGPLPGEKLTDGDHRRSSDGGRSDGSRERGGVGGDGSRDRGGGGHGDRGSVFLERSDSRGFGGGGYGGGGYGGDRPELKVRNGRTPRSKLYVFFPLGLEL